MGVKNTQAEKQIHNVFLRAVCLLGSFMKGVLESVVFFVYPKSRNNYWYKRSYTVLDFMFIQWPKYFRAKPTGYKITKFFADFIHHIFLKK